MSDMELALDHPLYEIAGRNLVQLEPYPVVVPRSVDVIRRVVEYARQQRLKILPLGTGSAFSAGFSLARSDVIAVLMAEYSGWEETGLGTVRVRAGTRVRELFGELGAHSRRTLGGLLSDSIHEQSAHDREVMLPFLRSLELISGSGEQQTYNFGTWGDHRDPGLAHLVCGGNGRMGIITAVEMRVVGTFPLVLGEQATGLKHSLTGQREACLSRAELISVFDRLATFQW